MTMMEICKCTKCGKIISEPPDLYYIEYGNAFADGKEMGKFKRGTAYVCCSCYYHALARLHVDDERVTEYRRIRSSQIKRKWVENRKKKFYEG